MDTGLVQGMILGLVALAVIVLIALLITLVAIRRALEELASSAQMGRGTGQLSTTEPAATGSTAHSDPLGYGGTAQGPGRTAAPAASAGDAGSVAEPATATQPAASTSATGAAATIRSVLEHHGLGETPSSSGASYQEPVAQPAAAEPVVGSVFAAHADDPQEEPFQREGRWWFRRGDELLLYDETTGQWEPAPATSMPGQPAAAPAAQQVSQTTAATSPMATVEEQTASFWKCATCGAVNGSTAATCRMCFAARP
ncbi:MAG: zinc finger Ran-binding domain-containing protein [Actinomycetota bacterium]|nr:zinc finger Ran-binding domain-containing protein [Actinomycetota bacterium]